MLVNRGLHMYMYAYNYTPKTEFALWGCHELQGWCRSVGRWRLVFRAEFASRWGHVNLVETTVAVAAKQRSVDLLVPTNKMKAGEKWFLDCLGWLGCLGWLA